MEGRVTEIARPRESISVKRSGLAKWIREGQDRRLYSPEFEEGSIRSFTS